MTQAKIEKQQFEHLTVKQLDGELRRVLASENRLHPALFSIEAEHKVAFLISPILRHICVPCYSHAFFFPSTGFATCNGRTYHFYVQARRSAMLIFQMHCQGTSRLCSDETSPELS